MAMKKILPVLLFILGTTLSYAQSDTIVKYYNHAGGPIAAASAFTYSYSTKQPDGLWVRVDFYVHNDSVQMKGRFTDKDLKNKTGPFSYYHYNGKMSSAGRYGNNKKEGLWLSWSADGNLTDSLVYRNDILVYGRSFFKDGKVSATWDSSAGDTVLRKQLRADGRLFYEGQSYANNREGRWKYYDTTGKLMMEAIYHKDSAIAFSCYDEKGNIQNENCVFEREAQVKGGSGLWRRHLERSFAAFYKGDYTGAVLVGFIIDTSGRITDVSIKASTEPRLNEAAIRIISSGPLWEPAIQYNRKVRSFHTQPLYFMVE
jgi:antitoxin component YwqK of YwqJK toxin-antitoxin module